MEKKCKPGGGNKPQPYVPKGNGEESGQYAKKDYADDYAKSEGCTKEELLKTLEKEELEAVKAYTNFMIGTALNKAIREKRMSHDDEILKNRIVSAISKHHLKNPVKVYRGIVVPLEVYLQNFVVKYLLDKPIEGSLICSTSRDPLRAAMGAKADTAKQIGIVFSIELPKGYPALPIEKISKNRGEKEILLSVPRYIIQEITECSLKGFRFKRIMIKIIGEKTK